MVTTAPFNDVSDRRAITVGTEFVRQYYTVLNSNPSCVHRFYSGDSAFVYGGVDRPGHEELPVRGQNNIHQRISEIGFKDPRCKILQIDAMFSEADCVLVQACGELSNNGGPMRRFMQSFLLKPKGEKAYYVLNSIFRYQDEVFGDDMDDAESSTVEEHHVGLDDEHPIDMADNNVCSREATPVAAVTEKVLPYANQSESSSSVLPPPGYEVLAKAPDATAPEVFNIDLNVEAPAAALEPENDANEEVVSGDEPTAEDEPMEQQHQKSSEIPTIASPVAPVVETPVPTKPKTWAALLTPSASTLPSNQASEPVKTERPLKESIDKAHQPQWNGGAADKDSQPLRSVPNVTNKIEGGFGSDKQTNGGGGSGFGTKNTTVRDNDAFQIFVGNLSPNLTEDELREFFSTFGEVDRVRITQGNPNKAGSRREGVPSIGFVIFKDRGSVTAVLNARPINIGDRRINVEEKRTQAPNNERGGRGGGASNRGIANQRGRGASFRGGMNQQSESRGAGFAAGSGGRGGFSNGGQRH